MGKQFCLGQLILEFVPSRGTPLKLLEMATFFADFQANRRALRLLLRVQLSLWGHRHLLGGSYLGFGFQPHKKRRKNRSIGWLKVLPKYILYT